jgi:hypothetical protein
VERSLYFVFALAFAFAFAVAVAVVVVVVVVVAYKVGPGFSPGIRTRRAAASTLPKARVQPEGRNDPSIALVLALTVACSRCKLQKPSKNACQAPKPHNSMKTNQI